MSSVVRKAVVDRRMDLSDLIATMTEQWQAVMNDQQSRKAEIDRVQADIDEMDAWLAANPAT